MIFFAALITLFLSGLAFADTSRIQWSWQDQELKSRPGFVNISQSGFLVSRPNFEGASAVELDHDGKIIWEIRGISVNSMQKLANGNYLIADGGAPGLPRYARVVEVTPDTRVIWEYAFTSRADAPKEAKRLENGNTLVVTAAAVMEINPEKKIVWKFDSGLLQAVSAARLENGNTLIVDKGIVLGAKVVEIDNKGEIVWSYSEGLKKPVNALRLQNGNTMIADLGNYWKIEISPQGEIIGVTSWRQVLSMLGFPAQRYARPLIEGGTIVSAGNRVMIIDDRSIQVYLNGNWLDVPVTPVLVNGSILLPVRSLADAFGWKLSWKADVKSLVIADDGKQVEISTENSFAIANGSKFELGVTPLLLENNLMVPASFLADNFGLKLEWDDTARILNLWK